MTRNGEAIDEFSAARSKAASVALAYLSDVVSPRLGIQGWLIRCDLEHFAEEGVLASVDPDPEDGYEATLRLSENFHERPELLRRETLIHEALHVRFFSVTEIVRKALKPELSASAYEMFWTIYRMMMEREITSLALSLADEFQAIDDEAGDGMEERTTKPSARGMMIG